MLLFLASTARAHCVEKTQSTCYADKKEHRVLPIMAVQHASSSLTREGCMQLCYNKQYALAGVEYGMQCFCGNAVAVGSKHAPSSRCSKKCSGNATQTCGNSDIIDVISTLSCTAVDPDPLPVPGPAPGPKPPSPSPPKYPTPAPVPAPKGAKNVVMIIVDDLRPEIGAYDGKWKMHTPNIDKLASGGLLFQRAYNQYAVCSPSRNSFMSGRRPDTTKVWNFKDDFRHAPADDGGNAGPAWITFPEAFKVNGYNTTGAGKTFHSGHPANFDQPYSWTEGTPYVGYNQLGSPGCPDIGTRAWCVVPDDVVNQTTDYIIASRAVELLESHAAHNVGPFAIFAGFIRPHLDWAAPQEYWDLYPADSIQMPTHRTFDKGAPKVAWVDGSYLDGKTLDLGGRKIEPYTPFPANITLKWRHAYYAAVSFMDAQVGRVLDAIDANGFGENTIVGFLADHGYQLGEHSFWEKVCACVCVCV